MERAIILLGESDDQRNLSRIKNAYAELLIDNGEAAAALGIINDCRVDMQLKGLTADLGNLEISEARALIDLGRLDHARDAINRALAHISPDSTERRAHSQLLLARIYRCQGDITACLREASHAAALEQAGTTGYASAAFETLGDLYRELDLANDAMDAYSHALKCVGIHASDNRRSIPTSNAQQR